MTAAAEQLATLTRTGPTLEDWAARLAFAGHTFDRGDDVLRCACPLCGPAYFGEWTAAGSLPGDGVDLIVAPGHDGEIEALCGRCGAQADAAWDQLEPLDSARVPGATPLGSWHPGTPVESPVNTGDSGVPTPGTLGTLSRCDLRGMLTSEPEPVDWIAEGVVARGALTLVAGREKEGKSLLLMALATCAATGGGSLAGIEVAPARTLVIDAENGRAEIHRRVRSLGLHVEHADSMEVYEAAGHDLRHHLDEVDRLLTEHHPDLVILDSWRSLWGGDENDSGEAARCLDPLRNLIRRHGAGAVLIHHMKKGGGYRGSSAIGASVENVIELARHDEDPDRRRRRLRNPSCRFAQEADDRWLAINADRERGLLFVEEAEAFRPAAGAREDAADVLLAALDQPLSWPFWARAAGMDPKDGTARRAREKLRGEGLVETNAQGHWTAREGA